MLLFLLACAWAARAQEIHLDGERSVAAKKGHVTLLSDSLVVAAGKPQTVELVFRVEQGFHINSHAPKDGLLIPTLLKLDPSADVRWSDESYPKGSVFRLSQGETLDVYQGEFRVMLRVVARKGESTLTGSLHYQACDNAACFPPRTLPVSVAVSAK